MVNWGGGVTVLNNYTNSSTFYAALINKEVNFIFSKIVVVVQGHKWKQEYFMGQTNEACLGVHSAKLRSDEKLSGGSFGDRTSITLGTNDNDYEGTQGCNSCDGSTLFYFTENLVEIFINSVNQYSLREGRKSIQFKTC